PGRQESLLRDVLAGVHVAGDGQRHGGDRILAGDDDAAVGIAVATDGGRQFTLDQQVDRFVGHAASSVGLVTGRAVATDVTAQSVSPTSHASPSRRTWSCRTAAAASPWATASEIVPAPEPSV